MSQGTLVTLGVLPSPGGCDLITVPSVFIEGAFSGGHPLEALTRAVGAEGAAQAVREMSPALLEILGVADGGSAPRYNLGVFQ